MTNLNRNEVAIEIEEILSRKETSKRCKWCIYRVPNDIRELNKEAYTPQVVSIGPFHYGNGGLQNMQIHKWEYFNKFVERIEISLDNLVSFIEELEPSIRLCYAENIDFDKKKFLKIILLDACFIIELFLRKYNNDWSSDDYLSPVCRAFDVAQFDLLLLENQLPFFVLEKLFNCAFRSSESNNLPSFLELTFHYFSYYNTQELNPDGVNICHLTDLLRFFHLQQHPSGLRAERIPTMGVLHFSATELHERGLRFKVNEKSKCLLELQLSGRILKIPKILVEDRTEALFHNMVAFEQCHCYFESYISDYIAILDCLIDTGKDVDLLVENGIILNYLDDSNTVAKLFNGLGKNVLWANFNPDYDQLCKKLNDFCTNPRQKLIATLKRDYCKTPWQTAASIAGMLLLFLTLLQTICSVVQVIQK